MSSIHQLPLKYDVSKAVEQIDAHPELWNRYTLRTAEYGTPHDVSDIWIRYNAWENYNGNKQEFNGPHKSTWYPSIEILTEVKSLVLNLYDDLSAEKLGGVLITKIIPGGEVRPHVDEGWHASYYQKYAIQLKGNKDQCFHFEDSELCPEPGDIYTFNNSKLHWVTNESDKDRITLIVCIRGFQ